MKGGYAMIDFKNSAAGTITNADVKSQFLAAVKSGKPVFGFNYAAGHGPAFCTPFESSTAYQLSIYSTPTSTNKNCDLYHYTYTKSTGALVLAKVTNVFGVS